eukprot:7752671-Karenia_brevis.AAC.1
MAFFGPQGESSASVQPSQLTCIESATVYKAAAIRAATAAALQAAIIMGLDCAQSSLVTQAVRLAIDDLAHAGHATPALIDAAVQTQSEL